MTDQVLQIAYNNTHRLDDEGEKGGNTIRTVGKGLKVLLEVGLGALAARADRDGEILEGSATRRELVQVWASMV